jgi:hypothetical protein
MAMKKLSLVLVALLLVGVQSAFAGLLVTPTNDASTLTNTILGSGITAVPGSPLYTGAAGASGTFTGGVSAGIGIDSGIILTSGGANLAPGPNNSDSATVNNGLPGTPALTALSGYQTYDATILKFTFTSTSQNLFFNYVFASEEYNEYANSSVNDVFGFFLDGNNIALIPGTSTPVSVNTVNGGNPFGTNAQNSAFFINNDTSDGGASFDIQYDGFTQVFTAQALGLGPGEHTIELAISDAGDSILDSAVFIQAGSFSDKPIDPVPEPATMILLGAGLVGLAGFGRKKFKK